MSLFNTHLLTDEERELLYRAGNCAAGLWDWKNPMLLRDDFMYNFTKAEIKTLEDIHRKIEERPFYYVHRHDEKATLSHKEHGKLTWWSTFPCPDDDEITSDILTSEGITDFVCYLESRDLMCHALVGSIMGWPSCHYAESEFTTYDALVHDSCFSGKENLEKKESELVYGNTERDTKKVVKIKSTDGGTVCLSADDKDKFEESLFAYKSGSLHKIVAQTTAKIKEGNSVISLSLDEYMKPRELTNKHYARAQLRRDIKALCNMSIETNTPAEEGYFHVAKYKFQKHKSLYIITFDDDFIKQAERRQIVRSVPLALFPLTGLVYLIAAYANLHRQRNANKPNMDIINIGTLLKRTYLPIDTTGQSRKHLVVDPLWKAFDSLYERRILYPQLVYPGSGEPVRETSEDYILARESLVFLRRLNIRVHWLCDVPNYTAKS